MAFRAKTKLTTALLDPKPLAAFDITVVPLALPLTSYVLHAAFHDPASFLHFGSKLSVNNWIEFVISLSRLNNSTCCNGYSDRYTQIIGLPGVVARPMGTAQRSKARRTLQRCQCL
jgi:hypothetical protein